MGQKVNPIGMRVGIIRDWQSRWYAEKDYGKFLMEDVKIRKFIEKKYAKASVARIEIERTKDRVEIIIRAAKPGEIIGQDGAAVEATRKTLEKMLGEKTVKVTVIAVANPNLDANLVARLIADQLEARASFRIAQKRAIQQVMRSGAKGVKTMVSGRLGGNDIARSEGYSEGVVPLHTLRSDIDYALAEAATTYGRLGVKVWICRGEVLPGEMVKEPEAAKDTRNNTRRPRRDDRRPRREDPRTEQNAMEQAKNEGVSASEVKATQAVEKAVVKEVAPQVEAAVKEVVAEVEAPVKEAAPKAKAPAKKAAPKAEAAEKEAAPKKAAVKKTVKKEEASE